MNDIFSPIEALRFGWYTLKKNIIFFLVLMVIVAVLYAFPFMIGMIFPPLYDNLSQAPISGPTIILIIVVTISSRGDKYHSRNGPAEDRPQLSR